MEEGGVTHHTKDLLVHLAGQGERLGHTHRNGEAAAHADTAVYGIQGLGAAQSVAANVAADYTVLSLAHCVEEAAVGAAGTQCRGPGGHSHVRRYRLRLIAEHHLPQALGIQLIQAADQFLAHAGDSGGLDLLLHEALQLLHNIQLLHRGGKLPDQFHGQRVS